MSKQVKNAATRATSDLAAFIRADRVREELDRIGNKFLTVTFIKVDGTERTVNGQLRAVSRLVGNERGQAQGEAMRARGQVWIATPQGESKSFYVDRVLRIKSEGLDIQAGA